MRVHGETDKGKPIVFRVDDEGRIVLSGDAIEVPAPVGGATEAKQDSEITQLTAIAGSVAVPGVLPYKNLDVDETEDEVKGTAGRVYFIHAINRAATVRYLKFYNATAAVVAVGTTVPVLTLPIPTQGDALGAGFVLVLPSGIVFSTAITIAATTGFADDDTGAPDANDVIVNLGYV